MRLSATEVIYHFQMSAVAVINGLTVEGSLSPYSSQTTVFVPDLGGELATYTRRMLDIVCNQRAHKFRVSTHRPSSEGWTPGVLLSCHV